MFKKDMLFLVFVFIPMMTWAQTPTSPEGWTRYFNASFLPPDEAQKYKSPQSDHFSEIVSKQSTSAKQPSPLEQSESGNIAPQAEASLDDLEMNPVELIYQLPDEIRKEELAFPSSELKGQYQLYQSQYPIDQQAFDYARSLLSSVETNGWLVVNGHLDTYPLRALQSNQGFRTDVQVVNLQWLRDSPEYRQLIANRLDILEFPKGTSMKMIRLLQANLSERLHLSMTLPTDIPGSLISEIAPRGLVFSLNKQVDHRSTHHEILESVNWQSVAESSSPEYIQALNQNYLAALLIHQKMQLPENIGGYDRQWLLEQLYRQRSVKSSAQKYLLNE